LRVKNERKHETLSHHCRPNQVAEKVYSLPQVICEAKLFPGRKENSDTR
jgi:hypothetical protein